MAFPTSPDDGDEYTNALGTKYKYHAADDKWYIMSVVAGDFLHNDLDGLNVGDVYEHISQAQKDDLHAIYTLEVHDNDEHSPNYSAEGHTHVEANITDLDHLTDAEAVQAVEDAGLVLSLNKTISFDAEQNDTTYSGFCMDIDTTGCNLFDLVYIDGNDSVLPADATDDTKMPAIGIVVAAGKVLTHGTVKDDDLIKCTTPKALVYASTTLREVTETAPNQPGEMIQVVGICVGDHTLFVNVSLDMVEFV